MYTGLQDYALFTAPETFEEFLSVPEVVFGSLVGYGGEPTDSGKSLAREQKKSAALGVSQEQAVASAQACDSTNQRGSLAIVLDLDAIGTRARALAKEQFFRLAGTLLDGGEEGRSREESRDGAVDAQSEKPMIADLFGGAAPTALVAPSRVAKALTARYGEEVQTLQSGVQRAQADVKASADALRKCLRGAAQGGRLRIDGPKLRREVRAAALPVARSTGTGSGEGASTSGVKLPGGGRRRGARPKTVRIHLGTGSIDPIP